MGNDAVSVLFRTPGTLSATALLCVLLIYSAAVLFLEVDFRSSGSMETTVTGLVFGLDI